MELKILIILHTMAACIWVGGHLVLAIGILPKALQSKDPKMISDFESVFERIGIPALLIQVITGIRMALIYLPISEWTSGNPLAYLIRWKLLFLFMTLALAIHARVFIIPKLDSFSLPKLGYHIIAVTGLSLAFLVVGLGFRLSIF
ncbi:MAG: CopD family protein [Leptospira sp.]|nr:CopD family protein [Leptospira sp.]